MVTKAQPTDAGCWIDGHWGQFGVARLVQIAEENGYTDAGLIDLASRHLAAMGPSTAPDLTDDEHEILSDGADEVEAWLNEHIAPEGYSFGWQDGEFFLQSAEWWQEEAY